MIGQLERVHFESAAFQRKLDSALTIVTAALRDSRAPYIAFSGGKDSTAVTGLVHAIRPDVLLVWSDDELELPETVHYMTQLRQVAGDQLLITLGHARHAGWFDPWCNRPFWREPFPDALRIGRDVDQYQAESGYDLVFTGLRMDENRRRRDWLGVNGPLYRVRSGCRLRCCPIWDWTADDVWALIISWNLAYNAAYDRFEEIRAPRQTQRVGPLPLARRQHLAEGWPDLLSALERRYGLRWE